MRKFGFGVMLGALCIIGAGVAVAARVDPACIQQANQNRKACRADCLDKSQEAKDLCRNIDPVCADNCRARRALCTATPLATLDGCLDVCRAGLDTAKTTLCPPAGDPARDACVDAAQVIAFICRDTCHEDQTVRDALKQCRKDFRMCLRSCGPPPAP